MSTTIRDEDLGSLKDLFRAMKDRPAHLDDMNPESLPAFARVLLVTDGTVTHMLRAHFREAIHVDVLSQELESLADPVPWLEADKGEDILVRKVALKGASTGTPYARATSWIALGRLSPQMKSDIVELRRSIGHVLLANFSENRREMLWFGGAATEGTAGQSRSLERAYRVIAGGKPLMIIAETFSPEITRQSDA